MYCFGRNWPKLPREQKPKKFHNSFVWYANLSFVILKAEKSTSDIFRCAYDDRQNAAKLNLVQNYSRSCKFYSLPPPPKKKRDNLNILRNQQYATIIKADHNIACLPQMNLLLLACVCVLHHYLIGVQHFKTLLHQHNFLFLTWMSNYIAT